MIRLKICTVLSLLLLIVIGCVNTSDLEKEKHKLEHGNVITVPLPPKIEEPEETLVVKVVDIAPSVKN